MGRGAKVSHAANDRTIQVKLPKETAALLYSLVDGYTFNYVQDVVKFYLNLGLASDPQTGESKAVREASLARYRGWINRRLWMALGEMQRELEAAGSALPATMQINAPGGGYEAQE